MGFQLPSDPHLEEGALLTQPPGREEAFLPFVASQVSGWLLSCLNEAGAPLASFAFRVDERGALVAVAPAAANATPRERCLAAHAAGTRTTTPLPPQTTVTVQLAIKTAPR